MSKPRFKWVIEISVDPRLVADGFDMQSYCGNNGNALLPSCYGGEITAHIIEAPDADRVAKEQGYQDHAQRIMWETKRRAKKSLDPLPVVSPFA